MHEGSFYRYPFLWWRILQTHHEISTTRDIRSYHCPKRRCRKAWSVVYIYLQDLHKSSFFPVSHITALPLSLSYIQTVQNMSRSTGVEIKVESASSDQVNDPEPVKVALCPMYEYELKDDKVTYQCGTCVVHMTQKYRDHFTEPSSETFPGDEGKTLDELDESVFRGDLINWTESFFSSIKDPVNEQAHARTVAHGEDPSEASLRIALISCSTATEGTNGKKHWVVEYKPGDEDLTQRGMFVATVSDSQNPRWKRIFVSWHGHRTDPRPTTSMKFDRASLTGIEEENLRRVLWKDQYHRYEHPFGDRGNSQTSP